MHKSSIRFHCEQGALPVGDQCDSHGTSNYATESAGARKELWRRRSDPDLFRQKADKRAMQRIVQKQGEEKPGNA